MLVNRVIQIAGIPLLLSVVLFGSTKAFAHHSFAMFDSSKSITVEGTVKNVAYANPHVWVDMVVMNDKNQAVTWGMEGGTMITVPIRPRLPVRVQFPPCARGPTQ